jgi:small neutral amino acid transporter SnatA (MarC family)
VLVVSGPHWHSRAWAVILGSGGVFAVFFALVLGGLSQLPDAGKGTDSRSVYIVEVVAGVVLVVLAVWMLRPHPQADQRMEQKVRSHADHASPLVFAGLAAYMSLTDFSTFVFLLPALHAVTRSVVAVPEKAVVVAFLFVCVLIPVLVPALTVRLVGDRGVRALNRVYNLLMGHQIQVMGVVAAVIGVVLLVRGSRGL